MVFKLPHFNVFSLFFGAGMLAALLGAVSLGPPVNRHACTIVVMMVGVCALIRVLDKGLVRRWNAGVFAALVALVLLSLIGFFVYRTHENALYAVNFIYNFFVFCIVAVLATARPHVLQRVIVAFLAVVALFAILQISYMVVGVGMNPTMVQHLNTDYDSLTYGHAGIRSVFVNTNDSAVICSFAVLWLLYATDCTERTKGLAAVALGTMAVMSGSRGGVIAFCLIAACYYLSTVKRAVVAFLGMIVLAIGIGILLSDSGVALAQTYFGAKLATITDVAAQYWIGGNQNISNGSVSLRMDTYGQFFDKFWQLGMGSLSAQDYGYIIKGSWLMSQDPHSLPIELGLLYGYSGVAAFILLMAWILAQCTKCIGTARAIVIGSCFLLLCCESSSSIGHRAFWGLLFAFVWGMTSMHDSVRAPSRGGRVVGAGAPIDLRRES